MRYNEFMPTQPPHHDTTPEAESILVGLLQDKPAEVRLEDAVAASNRVAQLCKEAIRRNNQDWSEEEVKLRFIAINYGKDIAAKVRAHLGKKR